MNTILKSLLDKDGVEVSDTIGFLLGQPTLLAEEEIEALQFMREAVETSQQTPTLDFLIQQVPALEEGLKTASELSGSDLRVHLGMVLEGRKRQRTARDLMGVATLIPTNGFLPEYFDKLRSSFREARKLPDEEVQIGLSALKAHYEERKSKPIGLTTCVKALDELIGGLSEGTVNTFAGFTGSYKTTWAVNIAYHNAYHLGFNIVYISLEVSKEDLGYNILSRHSVDLKFDKFSFIPHDMIRKGMLLPEQEAYLFDTILPDWEENGRGKLVILEESDFRTLSFEDITFKLEEVAEKIGGIDAVIFDHLQLLKFVSLPEFAKMQEFSVANAYVSFIRSLALDFMGKPICCIILSQTNREGWARAVKSGGAYDLRAIAEANELERASYRVFSVFADETTPQTHSVKVQLLKNRSGRTTDSPEVTMAEGESYAFGDAVEGQDSSLTVDMFDSFMSGF